MSAFIQSLRKRGIEVRLVNGRVRIGPREKITDHILEVARQHKNEILAEVHAEVKQCVVSSGWCAVRSAVLGETIVIIKDESTAVPARYSSNVTYTLAELVYLHHIPSALLRKVHEVKRVFCGRVVQPDDYPFGEVQDGPKGPA